jgi:3-hydroxy acid dehydrogenase / malonic semialdehyde reductase
MISTASKHAVDAISRTLLLELVDTPLRVTQINPGMVNTEFSTVRFGGDSTKADAVYKGLQPLVGEDIGEHRVYWSLSYTFRALIVIIL